MSARDGLSDTLIVEALQEEAATRGRFPCLLIGAQACGTVSAANRLVGVEHVALLHLDRADGGVGCGMGNAEGYLSADGVVARAPGGTGYATVAVNVEAAKSYRLLRQILEAAPAALAPDGVVLVAGPKKGGADVAATALREMFEDVVLLTYRKGHRVYRASHPRQSAVAGSGTNHADRPPVHTVSLRGLQISLETDDRIFARGRLDPATAMLAGCFEIPPAADVLDLGCGGGVLGILAALLDPTSAVTLVDADPIAVEVSRQNAALNGAANVTVHLSDVLRDLPGRTFDAVLMNPPFHQGRAQDLAIAHRFISEAAAALRPHGRLYVVCNRFLRYEPVIEQHVGSVREVAGDQRYKVLLGERRA